MRIRKKLIFLHTFFSLVLAGILRTAVWPAITRVVQQAEFHEARFALSVALGRIEQLRAERPGEGFDADTALPLRNEREITVRSDSLIGGVTYTESGSFTLTSMTPLTP